MNNVTNISQVTKPYKDSMHKLQMNNVWSMSSQNVGYVLLYMFSLHLTWRPLAALLLAFPAIAMACLLPLPETPYWLARWNTCDCKLLPLPGISLPLPQIFHPEQKLKEWSMCRQGRLEEARQALAWLREGKHFSEEEHEILEVFGFIYFCYGTSLGFLLWYWKTIQSQHEYCLWRSAPDRLTPGWVCWKG